MNIERGNKMEIQWFNKALKDGIASIYSTNITINKFTENSIFLVNNNNKIVKIVGNINIIPPIVGVALLLLWLSTYTLIFWPNLIFFKKGIATSPNNVETIKPIINANKDLVKVNI